MPKSQRGDPKVGGRAVAMRADRTASGCDATGRTSCRPAGAFGPRHDRFPGRWPGLTWSRPFGTWARSPAFRHNVAARWQPRPTAWVAWTAVNHAQVQRSPVFRHNVAPRCQPRPTAWVAWTAANHAQVPTGRSEGWWPRGRDAGQPDRVGTWCNGGDPNVGGRTVAMRADRIASGRGVTRAIRTLVAGRSRCGPTGPRRDVV